MYTWVWTECRINSSYYHGVIVNNMRSREGCLSVSIFLLPLTSYATGIIYLVSLWLVTSWIKNENNNSLVKSLKGSSGLIYGNI